VRIPIRARLTAWYALLAALALAVVGAFLVLKLRSDLRSTIDREVRSAVSVIEQSYLTEGHRGFIEASAASLRRTGAAAQVLGPNSRVLALYGGDLAEDPLLTPERERTVVAGRTWLRDVDLGDSSQPFRVAAAALDRGGSRQVIVVAESLSGVDEAVRKVLVLLLIVGPIVLVAASLAAWLLVRNALLPVDRMRRMAEEIGIDQLHERLSAPNSGDQIGRLAATLNAMLDRLEAGMAARRQLVADASHELRTPLAAMRAELDVSLRDPSRTPAERTALESVREDVDRMTRTVGNLLTLALADEGGLELLRTPVDLAPLAENAVDPLRALAALGQVTLDCEGEPCWTTGDPQRLTQALTNLVENAIKFTPAGGRVTVSTWRRGSEVGVAVADTGVGIDTDLQSQIFERFYRADGSRSRASGGSGLGRAICKEIAVAHGGRIWVESQSGHGSRFLIALPAGRPAAPADVPAPVAADMVTGARSTS
jgi:heavy metal sensor kinase